jgi:hypothetical protein
MAHRPQGYPKLQPTLQVIQDKMPNGTMALQMFWFYMYAALHVVSCSGCILHGMPLATLLLNTLIPEMI